MRGRNGRIDVRRYRVDVRGGGFLDALEALEELDALEELEKLEEPEALEKLEARRRAMAEHGRR